MKIGTDGRTNGATLIIFYFSKINITFLYHFRFLLLRNYTFIFPDTEVSERVKYLFSGRF